MPGRQHLSNPGIYRISSLPEPGVPPNTRASGLPNPGLYRISYMPEPRYQPEYRPQAHGSTVHTVSTLLQCAQHWNSPAMVAVCPSIPQRIRHAQGGASPFAGAAPHPVVTRSRRRVSNRTAASRPMRSSRPLAAPSRLPSPPFPWLRGPLAARPVPQPLLAPLPKDRKKSGQASLMFGGALS